MNTKRPVIIAVCGAVVLLCAWFFTAPPIQQTKVYSIAHTQMVVSNLQVQTAKFRSDAVDMEQLRLKYGWETGGMPGYPLPVINPKFSNPTNWPDDARPEVKAFYKLAKAAKLYNFDPQITYFTTNSNQRSVSVETPTYDAEIDLQNNKIPFVSSKYDSTENMAGHPEAKQNWTTGKSAWNQDALIEQTLNILQEFAFPNTVQGVLGGRQEIKIPEYIITSPDGGRRTYYPFATVILHDAIHDEQGRVRAEYRLGENGSAQLVRWSAW